MKVLVFLDYFSPAFKAGGPIRIFESLAAAGSAENEIFIVTQNHDWSDSTPLPGIESNQWTQFSNAKVFYASPDKTSKAAILDRIREVRPDVVHMNSLFSRTWTMKLLGLRKNRSLKSIHFILSPHGELSPSALNIKSGRKILFLRAAKFLGLFSNLHWLATAEKEKEEILKNISSSAHVSIAPPPLPPVVPHASEKRSGRLRVVFLARLSAMKNVGFLLQILPHLKGAIELDVYGPIDSAYESEWASILKRLHSHSEKFMTRYLGPVPSSESLRIFANYDVSILPSLGENFGYSIVESLAAGTPVVISDRTPWNEINEVRIGAALPLESPEAWRKALQDLASMDQAEWQQWSQRAQAWVKSRNTTADDLLKAYRRVEL